VAQQHVQVQVTGNLLVKIQRVGDLLREQLVVADGGVAFADVLRKVQVLPDGGAPDAAAVVGAHQHPILQPVGELVIRRHAGQYGGHLGIVVVEFGRCQRVHHVALLNVEAAVGVAQVLRGVPLQGLANETAPVASVA